MLKIYTTDEVKEAMLATGKQWFGVDSCDVCHTSIGYRIEGQDLCFDDNCLCSVYTEPGPRDWDDVAILINNNPDNLELKSVFGLIEKGE